MTVRGRSVGGTGVGSTTVAGGGAGGGGVGSTSGGSRGVGGADVSGAGVSDPGVSAPGVSAPGVSDSDVRGSGVGATGLGGLTVRRTARGRSRPAAVRRAAGFVRAGHAADGFVRTLVVRTGTDGAAAHHAAPNHPATGRPRSVCRDRHLALDVDASPPSRLLDCADVLRGSHPRRSGELLREATELADAHPGCALVMLRGRGGWWAGALRGGRLLLASGPPGSGTAPATLLPSCVYAWVAAGHDPAELAGVIPVRRVRPAGAGSVPRRPD